MRRIIIAGIVAVTTIGVSQAQNAMVHYDCKFVANKDGFTKEQHKNIDAFIAKREMATVDKIVKMLGGSSKDRKMAKDNVKISPANFSVNPKAFKKHDKFTVRGDCNVKFAARHKPKMSTAKFTKTVTNLTKDNINAVENFIAKQKGYKHEVDKTVKVDMDVSD